MTKVLHIISSPRGRESFSIKLGEAIVTKICSKYPDTKVEEFNLTTQTFPHLEEIHLASFFTPADNRSAEQALAVKHSDHAISQIQDADIIVIGAPLYNFGIHSTLKAWIDHIVRAGITFSYGENGVEGLVKNKKAYIALASGGVYSEGPAKEMDFVAPYLKSILGFIGITDISVFRVEGTAMVANPEIPLRETIDSIIID